MREFLPQLIATGILLVSYPPMRLILSKITKKYAAVTGRLPRVNHILRIIFTFLNIAVVIVLFFIWGVDPQNLFVAFSSLFAIIGVAFFAQWSLLSNVTAGIIIFFSSPFKIGDTITIIDKDAPIEAVIEDILTFHTHLKTKNGELIVYPNSLFLQRAVAVVDASE